ncbi:9898_t:CDS:2 [Funneliformis geosporum]|nr:9898_t:CDS:2 [Funneliformis geosporum]
MTKSSTDSEIVKVDIKGCLVYRSSRLAKKTIICHTVDDIKKILLTDILNLIAILRNHIDIDVNKAKQIKVFSMQKVITHQLTPEIQIMSFRTDLCDTCQHFKDSLYDNTHQEKKAKDLLKRFKEHLSKVKVERNYYNKNTKLAEE